MALTPEKKVKDKCVKLLKAYGVYYFFPATHGFGRSGVPDIICCVHGKFLGIECKAGKNTPTGLQELEMAKIRSAGGVAIVINEENITMLDALLKELNDGHQEQRRGDSSLTHGIQP
jgi:Holliday junction resolvase